MIRPLTIVTDAMPASYPPPAEFTQRGGRVEPASPDRFDFKLLQGDKPIKKSAAVAVAITQREAEHIETGAVIDADGGGRHRRAIVGTGADDRDRMRDGVEGGGQNSRRME